VYVDIPRFKGKWNTTIEACEKKLNNCLIELIEHSQGDAKRKFESDQKIAAKQLISLGVERKEARIRVTAAAEKADVERNKWVAATQQKKIEKAKEQQKRRANSEHNDRDSKQSKKYH